MTTRKLKELGIDYEGVGNRHLQVNEEVLFNNDIADRILVPECGAFYVESLEVRNINGGEILVKGIDYEVFLSDAVATAKSGKEVCGVIIITNPTISGVLLTYQFVGGLHKDGYYLLEQLLKMYPKGTNAIINYDDILQLPELFDPAYHTEHVVNFYDTKSLLVKLERCRQALHHRQNGDLAKMYEQASQRFFQLSDKLGKTYQRLTATLADILRSISIQGDEYIFTDSGVNPATTRGYGNWKLVTNAILKGGPSAFLVGSGSAIDLGSDQVIRNCYIWKNVSETGGTESSVTIAADKTVINEGEAINFTINTTNIPNATKLAWVVDGGDKLDFSSAVSGTATINNGSASVRLTSVKDYRTDGVKNYKFRLKDYPLVAQEFTILDTSQDRKITAVSFIDLSNKKVETVNEDQQFKLRISTTGLVGQTVYLKWSADVIHLANQPPTSMVITKDVEDIFLSTVGNLETNPVRNIEVYVLEQSNEAVISSTPFARVLILDTSTELQGNLTFLNAGDLIVNSLDEDKAFKIKLNTNGGVGRSVNFTYRSNKPLGEFEGLISSAVIDVDNAIIINARHIADYENAIEQQFLEVTAINTLTNKVIAVSTVLINDTTRSPNFNASISRNKNGDQPITSINEGEDFYLVFKVPGWVGSTTPLSLDLVTNFIGSPNFASRVQGPATLSNLLFNDSNNIDRVEWVGTDTLAIRYTAIADKAIRGNAEFSYKWKLSNSTNYKDGASKLTIVDTSKPNLSATFSSSATELIPITTVNEMKQGNGVRFYLWVNVDGDASTVGNISLDFKGSQAGQNDIVQVFPQSYSLVQGSNKTVITIDTIADFLNEGNEVLTLEATQVSTGATLFTSSITIIDNSVQLAMSNQLSASTYYNDGKYSEWESVNITINVAPVDFATTLEISASGNTSWVTGIPTDPITIAANQSSYVIKLDPKTARREIGDYSLTLSMTRKYGSKIISPVSTAQVSYHNDRRLPTIEDLVFLDSSNVEVTQLEEGKSYKVKAKINNPMDNMAVVIANTNTNIADVGTSAGWGRFDLPRRLVNFKTVDTRGLVETNPISFSVVADRTTNPTGLKLDASLVLDWGVVAQALKVGDSYTAGVTEGGPDKVVKLRSLPIMDTSKTTTYVASYSKTANGVATTSFDEGDDIFFKVQLTNATIGDVYQIANSGAVTDSRFSYHEFNSKNITITASNQLLVFKGTFLKNYQTDGDKVGSFILKNLNSGFTEKVPVDYTLADTTKTLGLSVKWLKQDGVTVAPNLSEGETVILEVTTANLVAGSTIQLINPTGRPLSDFSVAEVNLAKAPDANGVVKFTFSLAKNYKVDTLNTLGVTAQVVQTPATVVNTAITIIDSTTAPTYNIDWYNPSTNAIISKFSEGATAELRVAAIGVAVGTSVQVTLTGTVTADDFTDAVLTKTASMIAVNGTEEVKAVFSWSSVADLKTEGPETVNANVYVEGKLIKTVPITLEDTSVYNPTFNTYLTSDALGNTPVSQINEGGSIYLVLECANLPEEVDVTWTVSALQGSVASVFFPKVTGSIRAKNGKSIVQINTQAQEVTTGDGIYTVKINILQNEISTASVKVIDIYKTVSIDTVYFAKNADGTTGLATVSYGAEFYLIIKTTNIKPGAKLAISFPTKEGVDQSYFAVGTIEGTQLLDVGTYTPADGKAHTWYKMRMIDVPTA